MVVVAMVVVAVVVGTVVVASVVVGGAVVVGARCVLSAEEGITTFASPESGPLYFTLLLDKETSFNERFNACL